MENKNLATCSPLDFFKQTNRIRKSAEKWMNATKILEIRTRKVEGLEPIPKDNEVEAARIRKENAEKIVEQRRKNVNDILDAVLEKYPEKTLEVLALACFVEPEKANEYGVSFYLRNLADILANPDVIGFFTSLAQLEQTGILNL